MSHVKLLALSHISEELIDLACHSTTLRVIHGVMLNSGRISEICSGCSPIKVVECSDTGDTDEFPVMMLNYHLIPAHLLLRNRNVF